MTCKVELGWNVLLFFLNMQAVSSTKVYMLLMLYSLIVIDSHICDKLYKRLLCEVYPLPKCTNINLMLDLT